MPDVDNNIQKFIETISGEYEGVDAEWVRPSIVDNARELDGVTDELKDDFAEFLQTADLSGDIMGQYQTHLQNASVNTSRFSDFISKAKGILKSFGATIASIGVNWAIGEIIGLVSTGINHFINLEKEASDVAQKVKEESSQALSEDKETSETFDELIKKYKELRETSNYDENAKKNVLDIQDQITNLVGIQAKNLDLVNGKLDTQLEKLEKIKRKQAKKTLDDSEVDYYSTKDAANKLVGDASTDGFLGTGLFSESGYDFVKDYGYYSVFDPDSDFNRLSKILGKAGYNDIVNANDSFTGFEIKAKGNSAKEKEKYLQGILDALRSEGETNNDLFTGISAAIKKYTEANDDVYKKAVSYANTWLNSSEEVDTGGITSVADFEKRRTEIIDKLQNTQTISDAIGDKDLNKEDIEQIVDSYMSTCEDFSTWYEQWKNSLNDTSSDKTAISLSDKFDSVWDSKDNKATRKKLEKLAKSGELTKDTVKSVEDYKNMWKSTNLEIDDFILKIKQGLTLQDKLSMFSKDTKKVGQAYKDYKKNGYVSSNSLNNMPESFKSLEGYTEFNKTVRDKKASSSQKQSAFNDIVTEYLSVNKYLDDLSSETSERIKKKITTALKDAGVRNAKEVVESYIQESSKAKNQLVSLSEQTNKFNDDEFRKFVEYYKKKGKVSTEFVKQIGTNNANMINGLSDQYKDDLANWLELCRKKKEAYNLLAKAVGGSTPTESKNNYKKLTNKDESKLTAEDMGAYEAATKAGFYTNKKGKVTSVAEEKEKKALKGLKINPIKADFKLDYHPTTSSGDGSKKSKDSSKKAKEEINWLERALTVLQKKLDTTASKLKNLFSVKSKNKNLDSQIKQIDKQVSAYDKVMQKYNKKMSQADKKNVFYKNEKKNDDIIKKIKNGKLSGKNLDDLISTYGEKRGKKIKSYIDYYDNYLDAQQKKEEKIAEKRELQIQKQTNIQEEADKKTALYQTKRELAQLKDKNGWIKKEIQSTIESYDAQIKAAQIQKDNVTVEKLKVEKNKELLALYQEQVENIKSTYDERKKILETGVINNNGTRRTYGEQYYKNQVDLTESRGLTLNVSWYKEQNKIERDKIAENEKERQELIAELSKFAEGTTEWYNLQSDIADCDNSIIEAKKAINENSSSIRELKNSIDEKIGEFLNSSSDELDFISGLLYGEETDTDKGILTDAGNLRAITDGLKIAFGESGVNEFGKQLSTLEKLYSSNASMKQWEDAGFAGYFNDDGTLNTKAVEDKIKSLRSEVQSYINMQINGEKELIELGKQKYEAQKSYLQDIINAKKDMLNIEKDIFSYERDITDKTKSVANLQKQLNSIRNDDSEEGRARLSKLQVSLDEAQRNLQDSEYERYISDQQNMLDNLMTEYEDLLTNLTKDTDKILLDMYDYIKKNEGGLGDLLIQSSEKYGYATSQDLIDIVNALKGTNFVINKDVAKDNESGIDKVIGHKIINKTTANTNSPANVTSNTSYAQSVSNAKTQQATNAQQIQEAEKMRKTDVINRALIPMKSGMGTSEYWTKSKGTPSSYVNQRLKNSSFNGNKILTEKGARALANTLRGESGFRFGNGTDLTKKSKNEIFSALNDFFKASSFATGGIVDYKPSGEDGLVWARNGEGFVRPEDVPPVKEFVKYAPKLNELFQPLVDLPKAPDFVPNRPTNTTSVGNVQFSFTLPNVLNGNDLIKEIQTNPKIQRSLQEVTLGQASGNGKLSVNRIR